MKVDLLVWIQNWFEQNCNGDWEHLYGIKIETVDNPGWSVEINLSDTYLEKKRFNSIEVNKDEEDWFYCIVKDGVFTGAGGVKNLSEILNIFKQWASDNED
jgi:hypothetical protein